MSETKFTPGPWKAIRIGGELTGSVFAGKKRICSGICDDVRLVKEAEANSALIEAAPDILEALEGAKWAMDSYICAQLREKMDEYQDVVQVIQKARGEE